MSTSKKIYGFAAAILTVFIISVACLFGFAGYTIVQTETYIPTEYSTLTSSLQSLTETEELYSAQYADRLCSLIENTPNLAAFVLYQDNNPAFVWPVGSTFITADGDNNPIITASSPISQVKEGYFLTGKGVTKYYAAFTTITSASIYRICSHAFITILVATVLCLMTIAYISLFRNRKPVPVSGGKQPESHDESLSAGTIAQDEDYENDYPYPVDFNDDIDGIFDEQDKEVMYSKAVPEEQEEIEESPCQEYADESIVVEAARPQAEIVAAPKKRVLKESEDPLGLFSDLTGFGWESYLETRLDSELIRAASSEFDLALFIVRINGVNRTHPKYDEICSSLLTFFKFRDLVFEYGSDGFAGIVTGMDINGCMATVENLYNSLTTILAQNGIEGKVCIGISTRSFRLIPGERLILEARDAVEKAQEEKDVPIVAFRVNPGKYREFLDHEVGASQEALAS